LVLLASAGCGSSGSPTDATVSGADGSMDTSLPCTGTEMMCGGRCIDTQSDPAHCGACGTACTAPQACVAGSCQIRCPGMQTVCGGVCVDLRTDRANCGACGTP